MAGSDVLGLLDQDWQSYRRSTTALREFRRWKKCDTSFDRVSDLEEVIAVARGPRSQGSDEILHALLVMAPVHPVAARVALQTLVPGLAGVVRTYRPRWGREETASMVVTAAFEKVVRYPCQRPGSPMGNLVRDVRHDLYELRLKEVALETALTNARAGRLPAAPSPVDTGTAAEELGSVLTEALANGVIGRRQAQLIYRRRVLGVSTQTLAEAEGLRPCTIRKHRREAERVLVASIREVA